MNFQGKAVLVYLQEDNIARAYFRIRPLLTDSGPVTAEDLAAFPDEGHLRIVPDKNEQHTFKERMRSMCGLCLMDLRFLPTEANKIRTNKNYSPSRGENNQFIIYSDAVRTLPENMLYQVIAEENASSAFTPQIYLRKGANIQGPFHKENLQPAGETNPLPPDSNRIYSVTVNDQELLFYWPRTETSPVPQANEPAEAEEKASPEETPAPQTEKAHSIDTEQNAFAKIQELNINLSDSANRLKEEQNAPVDFVPEQPQKPLVGTRLYQPPMHTQFTRRAHNPLMEAVEQQRYAAKYEAPGAVIPQNAELKDVQNPVDAFKRCLQNVCQTQEAQKQAVDMLISQPGMRNVLCKALAANKTDVTLNAMHTQLQELEAERLMTLMQLDDAKKNLAAAREEILGKLSQEEQKKLDQLRAQQAQEKKAAEVLHEAMAEIEGQREEAARIIETAKALQGQNVLVPPAGENCTREELIKRVKECFTAAGFLMSEEDAETLLVLFAQADWRLQLAAETKADAQTAAETLACALGAAVQRVGFSLAADDAYRLAVLPGGDAPALVIDQEDMLGKIPGAISLTLQQGTGSGAEISQEYECTPYAAFNCTADCSRLPAPLPVCKPVRKESIRQSMLVSCALSADTQAVIAALRHAIHRSGCALPVQIVEKVTEFIAATQNTMKGGVAEAIDRAVLAWVVPHIAAYQLDTENILPITVAMPRTAKALKNI